jgi:tetratricopeptide (TPR) repeat protein
MRPTQHAFRRTGATARVAFGLFSLATAAGVRSLAEAGVPILAGTDATAHGPVAGYAVPGELAEPVVAGLSPYRALAAAAAAPARYFGRIHETGTVAVGHRADLVLLAAGRIAGEEAINGLGYRLLARGRSGEAIALFETNVAEFPRSANALDSLADAWARSGREDKAIDLYRRALAVDSAYANAPFAREFLGKHAAKASARREADRKPARGAAGAKADGSRTPRTTRNAWRRTAVTAAAA